MGDHLKSSIFLQSFEFFLVLWKNCELCDCRFNDPLCHVASFRDVDQMLKAPKMMCVWPYYLLNVLQWNLGFFWEGVAKVLDFKGTFGTRISA